MGFWGNLFSRIRKAFTPVIRWIKSSFSYCIDKLADAGRALIKFYKEHPILGTVLIVGGLLLIVVPLAVGFWPGGIVAGSLAAAWHSSIGVVAAGSLFATLQSLSMTGTLIAAGGLMTAGGVAMVTASEHKGGKVRNGGDSGDEGMALVTRK